MFEFDRQEYEKLKRKMMDRPSDMSPKDIRRVNALSKKYMKWFAANKKVTYQWSSK